MEDGIKRALESSNKMFQQKCEKFTDSPVCSLQEAPLPQETANADVRGFSSGIMAYPFAGGIS